MAEALIIPGACLQHGSPSDQTSCKTLSMAHQQELVQALRFTKIRQTRYLQQSSHVLGQSCWHKSINAYVNVQDVITLWLHDAR